MCTLGMAGIFPSFPEGPFFNIARLSNRLPFLLVYQSTKLCKMLGEHKKKVGKHVLSVQLMIYKLLPTSQVSHHSGEMVQKVWSIITGDCFIHKINLKGR